MYGLVGFSRSQANGFLLLLPLLAVVLVSKPLFQHWRSRTISASADEADIRKLDSMLVLLQLRPESSRILRQYPGFKPFDPNSASLDLLTTVGLDSAVALRMMNYRLKGGRFRVKRDVLKIYGVDSAWYTAAESFILLPDSGRIRDRKANHNDRMLSENVISRKATSPTISDLNTADTLALMRVRGVGKKLAERILKYRNALGGFVSVEQLYEVYRLDSAAIGELRKSFFVGPDFIPVQLAVNTALREQLAVHPYLSPRAANAIVTYRFQHGDFSGLRDLQKIPLIDSVTLKKLLPYLKLE